MAAQMGAMAAMARLGWAAGSGIRLENTRYVNSALDLCSATQHNQPVSTILLQENSFKAR
jgi:hypothetical protein